MSRRRTSQYDDPAIDGAAGKIFAALNPMSYMPSNNPAFKFLTIVITLAVFAAIIWYSYPKERRLQNELAIPVIKAENKPFRVKPDDEGGMDVLFGDSTVFDTIASDDKQTERRIENLLSDEEEPLSRQAIFAGLKTELNTEPQTQTLDSANTETVKEEEKPQVKAKRIRMIPAQETAPASEKKKEVETNITASPTIKPETKPVVKASTPKAEPVKTPPASVKSGSYYVQLGSLKSETDAKSAWTTYQNKYKGLLPANDYRINKADISGKGIFYRLQAGPFAKDSADNICNTIKNKYKGGCFVIKG